MCKLTRALETNPCAGVRTYLGLGVRTYLGLGPGKTTSFCQDLGSKLLGFCHPKLPGFSFPMEDGIGVNESVVDVVSGAMFDVTLGVVDCGTGELRGISVIFDLRARRGYLSASLI